MSRLACVLLVAAIVARALSRPRRSRIRSPRARPRRSPTILIDAELQKEIDSINTELNVKLNCVPGQELRPRRHDQPDPAPLLMEVADRAFKIFEEIDGGAGGVAGPSGDRNGRRRPRARRRPRSLFGGRKCLIAVFNNGSQYQAFGKWYDELLQVPVQLADDEDADLLPVRVAALRASRRTSSRTT